MSGPNVALSTGANAPFGKEDTVRVTITWKHAPAELDVSCFMVGADGKVSSDDYFVFYNQPADPHGHVRLQRPNDRTTEFTVALQELERTGVEKCVFAATLDGPGTFADVVGCSVTAQGKQSHITYSITEATSETSLVLAEVYRHTSGFKLRAVGRGFNGGLKPLAEAHGVTVEETESPVDTVQMNIPTSAILSAVGAKAGGKETAPINARINLHKQNVQFSLKKKKIDREKARVAVVFDASISMFKLYTGGTVQKACERVLAVAACMDDDGEMDVWFFADKAKRAPSVTERNFENYIHRNYAEPSEDSELGWGNNEPEVMKDIILKYTKEDPNDMIPTYIIFFSDGGIYEQKKIEQLLIKSSSTPIFWQFVGLGKADYGILRKLDKMRGRVVDNADFFALDDIDSVTDAELYDRLLNEFPSWLKQVRAKGILRS
ncbi:VWA domain-containing protein [Paenibacillus sp. FSL M8-0228]|uniref:VWA domain-containing protein n=1 Tax=Paenibacillus TaxID=44249 RepID=UPI00083DF382|nr:MULTISPECIES: VWA domain-containing protein [Paenibacillus]MBO3286126.1 VWA domain-containing protein [Paenibacillus polymyxa]MBP1310821.1 stress response protein SCP2 [Paenibacillus sp. 1182]ODB57715.1 tellurium resistance protein TerF [Paenibacillus polymyxa]